MKGRAYFTTKFVGLEAFCTALEQMGYNPTIRFTPESMKLGLTVRW